MQGCRNGRGKVDRKRGSCQNYALLPTFLEQSWPLLSAGGGAGFIFEDVSGLLWRRIGVGAVYYPTKPRWSYITCNLLNLPRLEPCWIKSSLPTMLINWLCCLFKHSTALLQDLLTLYIYVLLPDDLKEADTGKIECDILFWLRNKHITKKLPLLY